MHTYSRDIVVDINGLQFIRHFFLLAINLLYNLNSSVEIHLRVQINVIGFVIRITPLQQNVNYSRTFNYLLSKHGLLEERHLPSQKLRKQNINLFRLGVISGIETTLWQFKKFIFLFFIVLLWRWWHTSDPYGKKIENVLFIFPAGFFPCLMWFDFLKEPGLWWLKSLKLNFYTLE